MYFKYFIYTFKLFIYKNNMIYFIILQLDYSELPLFRARSGLREKHWFKTYQTLFK